MTSNFLFYYTNMNKTLADVIADFMQIVPYNEIIGLLYSSRWCQFSRMDENGKLFNKGKEINPSIIFEARLFTPIYEMRWLNDPSPDQHHRAIILSENEIKENLNWEVFSKKEIVQTCEQSYLLWGEGTGKNDKGWSELGTARIGALSVPRDDVKTNERVLLRTIEYFAEYEDGNVSVMDERLRCLEVNRG